jgi:RecA/RadA recombinase
VCRYVVVDSVAALVPRSEIEGEIGWGLYKFANPAETNSLKAPGDPTLEPVK